MKHSYTKNKTCSIKIAGNKVDLTLLPCTYLKLIEIGEALGEGKSLNDVLNKQKHLDIAIAIYCLLDSKSKKTIDNIDIQIESESLEVNQAEKLFYLISDTNVKDGMVNYTTLLKSLSEHAQASFQYKSKLQKKSLITRIKSLILFWT